MARITFEMKPEEALRLLIDVSEVLDIMGDADELIPGRVQGGFLSLGFVTSVCAAVFDAEYFGGEYANEISLNQVSVDI